MTKTVAVPALNIFVGDAVCSRDGAALGEGHTTAGRSRRRRRLGRVLGCVPWHDKILMGFLVHEEVEGTRLVFGILIAPRGILVGELVDESAVLRAISSSDQSNCKGHVICLGALITLVQRFPSESVAGMSL